MSIFVYPNTISTFYGDAQIALQNGYVEVSDDDYDALIKTKKKWSDDALVDDDTYDARMAAEQAAKEAAELEQVTADKINALKQKLADTDYAIIKIAEGAATYDEYKDVIEQRCEWRDQIRELLEEGAKSYGLQEKG